jgi:hypothetical protein
MPNTTPRRPPVRTNVRAVGSLSSLEQAASDRRDVRMALYERYASLVAAEFAARAEGRRDDADELGAARDAVRGAWEALAGHPPAPAAPGAFADALADAATELAHQDAVDAALRERLDALGAEAARRIDALPASRGLVRRSVPTSPDIPSHRVRDDAPRPGTTLDIRL